MNRYEFCRKFAEVNDITISQSTWICESVFDLLSKMIVEEERVYIKGLGTFKKKRYASRRVCDIRNYDSGKTIDVPAQTRIIFAPYYETIDAVYPMGGDESDNCQEDSSEIGEEQSVETQK